MNEYQGKPFALLLPAYTANKSYWKDFVSTLEGKSNYSAKSSAYSGESPVLYVLPPDSYEYRHPEGTGKHTPPFYSAWFIGGFKSSHTEMETEREASSKGQEEIRVSVSNISDRCHINH